MELVDVEQQHITTLMSWIDDEAALYQWGGPGFRYPYDEQSFSDDLQLSKMASYALVDNGELVAFGQWYPRWHCIHLSRLIVAPNFRGKRKNGEKFSHLLVNQLVKVALGNTDILPGCQTSSLFVLAYNKAALKSYQQLGFEVWSCPEPLPIEDCLYMRRSESIVVDKQGQG
ncbi:GNAT family N-acetyltransferase [Shewanella sp. Scap07]|uniref:GNAT family N-acetyltransferase n=1 Tax=Shewanella sp. Scap07 TaxID=2589987 RepID=UPI0015B7B3F6|nr:GNAT family N-acetyltransferase [Shewanella sp. Scap07]QLE85310.1 GNAT family N-acetyltransferase [Shewanella sp. Scap07]